MVGGCALHKPVMKHVGVCQSGGKAVDPYAERGQLHGQGLGQGDHGRLRGGIGCPVGISPIRDSISYCDDRAAILPHQRLASGPAAEESAREIDGYDSVPVFAGHVSQATVILHETRAIHKDVHSAESRTHLGDQ